MGIPIESNKYSRLGKVEQPYLAILGCLEITKHKHDET